MTASNHIHLTGNVGGEVRTVTLESGTVATEFSLATNDYYRDRNGERASRTEWHRIKAFGKQAEVLGKYLRSGSRLNLVGTLRYDKWEDQHGQRRKSPRIYLEQFDFLGNRSGGDNDSAAATTVRELASVDPATAEELERIDAQLTDEAA